MVCLLLGGRGRLTSATYRLKAIELISEAQAGGAALVSACSEIGICLAATDLAEGQRAGGTRSWAGMSMSVRIQPLQRIC